MFFVRFSLGEASLPSSDTRRSRLIVIVSFGLWGGGLEGRGRGNTLLEAAPRGATLSLYSVYRLSSSSLSWLDKAITVAGGRIAAVCVLTLDLLISQLL